MKEWIARLLLPFADSMYNFIGSVPLGLVRAPFLGVFAALAFWVINMSPQLPETDRDKRSLLKDLRLFAVAILVLQSLLYIIF